MADISAKSAVNVTNEVKTRPVMDVLSSDFSGSQFVDVMMARLTALGSDDQDLKQIAKKLDNAGEPVQAGVLRQLKGLKEKAAAKKAENAEQTVPVDEKTKIKEKIKERIQEIASQNDIPVKDDASLKVLQKVAKLLIKADEKGTIDLPPELLQKLNDFLAKGDDLKAFDIASFMRDFSESFKTLTVALNQTPSEDALQWPAEIVDQLKSLKIGGVAQEGKDITLYDAVRVLKSLVNAGEKSAIATLNEKIEKALLPQDRADILVASAAATDGKEKTVDAATATPDDAQKIIAAAETLLAPELKKAQKTVTVAQADAQAKMELTAPVAAKPTDVPVKTPDIAVDADTLAAPGLAKNAALPSTKEDGDLSLKQMTTANASNAAEQKPEAKIKENAPAQATPAPQINSLMRAQLIAAAPIDVSAPVQAITGSALHTLNAMEAMTQNTPVSSARFAAALSTATQASQQPSEATQQVIVQMQQRGNKGSLSVQLTPAELGRVDVRLTTQRDGSVHAVIAADKPETLALLQKDAAQLEKALQQAGINTNAGNMSFNLREQRQSHQFDQGRKPFSRGEIEETSTKEVALTVTQEGIFSNDRVNYHA